MDGGGQTEGGVMRDLSVAHYRKSGKSQGVSEQKKRALFVSSGSKHHLLLLQLSFGFWARNRCQSSLGGGILTKNWKSGSARSGHVWFFRPEIRICGNLHLPSPLGSICPFKIDSV